MGIETDSYVTKTKGDRRPFFSQKDRAIVMASLAVVDYIIILNKISPQDIKRYIKRYRDLKPDLVVVSKTEKRTIELIREESMTAGSKFLYIRPYTIRHTRKIA